MNKIFLKTTAALSLVSLIPRRGFASPGAMVSCPGPYFLIFTDGDERQAVQFFRQ